MKRRIYGVEIEIGEYPMSFWDATGVNEYPVYLSKMVEQLPLSKAMRERLKVQPNCTNFFLLNEGRYYIDTGKHWEYATPETDDPRDCVIYEKAGERVFEKIVNALNLCDLTEQWRKTGGVTFLKGNTSPDETWGYHQNFLVERNVRFELIARAMGPFWASSVIWSGSGALLPVDGYLEFYFSPRARWLNCFESGATTSSRALVNNRDQAEADAQKYRRLHVIAKDAHLSEAVSFMDLALNGLILEMLEERFFDPSAFSFPLSGDQWDTNALKLLHTAKVDKTFSHTVNFNGGAYSALDVQFLFLEIMRAYERGRGIESASLSDALDRFEGILSKLEKVQRGESPVKLLSSVCDWAKYLEIVDKDGDMQGYRVNDRAGKVLFIKGKEITVFQRTQMLDMLFRDVRRNRGLHYREEANGRRERITTEEEVQKAIYTQPENTRANVRRWAQDEASRMGLYASLWDWTHVMAKLPETNEYEPAALDLKLPDPFQTAPPAP